MDKELFGAAMNNVATGRIAALEQELDACPDLARWSDTALYGTLLHRAVTAGQTAAIALLLQRGADPNAIDTRVNRTTPLHHAASQRNREAVDLLLDAGADLNRPDASELPPLYYLFCFRPGDEAAMQKAESLFFHMVENGASLADSRCLATAAAGVNMTGVIEFLLKKNGKPPRPAHREPAYRPASERERSSSPLRTAVSGNNIEAAAVLLKYGAAWGNGGDDGRDALAVAMEHANPEAALLLRDAGVSTDPGHYYENASLPLPLSSPAAMARALFEQNRNSVYFAHGYHLYRPPEEEFVAALALELEKLPPDLRRLAPLNGFRFVGAFLDRYVGEYLSNPENLKAAREKAAAARVDADVPPEFADLAEMQDRLVDAMAKGASPVVTVSKALPDVLKEVEKAAAGLDPRIGSLFLPGLPPGDVERAWKKFAAPLPRDLATLYAWRDGLVPEAEDLFKGYHFHPLEEAMIHMDCLAGLFPAHHYHIMENVFGCWIQYDTRPERNGLVCGVDREIPDAIEVYPSLAAFFGAFAECFRNGAFRIVAGRDGDVLVGGYEAMQATFDRYRFTRPGEIIPAGELRFFHGKDEGVSDMDYAIPL